jgi:hypothetical protein
MGKNVKKTALTLALILAILLSSVGLQGVDVANANPMGMKPGYTLVTIQSPKNHSYGSNPVIVNFTAELRRSYISETDPADPYIPYKIDEGKTHRISTIEVIDYKEIRDEINPSSPIANYPYYLPYADYSLKGSVILPYLDEGWHNLTVDYTTIEIYVEVSGDTPNNTPTPLTSPSKTPTQWSTVNPSKEAFQEKLIAKRQTFTIGILSIAVVITLGVLFYFKRRKGTQ